MAIHPDDDLSALGYVRERLYSPKMLDIEKRQEVSSEEASPVPHAWSLKVAPKAHPHVRLALVFFIAAVVFFIAAGGVAALILFTGSTAVSTDNITLTAQGPTTIAAGDTVPLSLAITNRNVVALTNATDQGGFPEWHALSVRRIAQLSALHRGSRHGPAGRDGSPLD